MSESEKEYKELVVIKKGKELVKEIYFIVKQLPKNEQYILIPQMLRAAISIPSNIAEGNQLSKRQFVKYLRITRGSLYELKIQLDICNDEYGNILINFEDHDEYLQKYIRISLSLIDEIGKMSYKLMINLISGV